MKKKYDYIVLPPDSFYTSFYDLLNVKKEKFDRICKKILSLSQSRNKSLIIKYRGDNQCFFYHPITEHAVGYGSFVKYCHSDSVIIGPVGSAFIEALESNLLYFPYDLDDPYMVKAIEHFFFIAKNEQELLNYILERKIKKKNLSEVLFSDSQTLKEIVSSIINN